MADQRLNELIQFYSEQKTKLEQMIEAETTQINSYHNIIPPAILLIQSAMLQWNVFYSELESTLGSNTEELHQFFSQKLEQIFITFAKMIQLKEDIASMEDSVDKSSHLAAFNENICQVERNHRETITNICDVLLTEFNMFVNGGTEQLLKSYQNFLKIMDGFQVKLAQYQNLITDLPQDLDNFLSFPSLIQEWEEIFDLLKQQIHLGGETIISTQLDIFTQILVEFNSYLKQEGPAQVQMEEFLEVQYASLLKINKNLIKQLSTHLTKKFEQNYTKRNSKMKEINAYINSHSEYLGSLNIKPDKSLISDLKRVSKKLNELLKKKKNGV